MLFKAELLNVDNAFTSVAWFTVKPGKFSDFEDAFRDSGMLTRPASIEGYLGAHLYKSTDESRQYCVIGQWTTREAYAQWQEIASHNAPHEALIRLRESLESNRLGVLFEGPLQ